MPNKKYQYAVGLEYEAGTNSAPTIGLKGEDFLADEIVKAARRFNIPVVEKPQLAKTLVTLQAAQQIPEELYHAVAVVLSELERSKR